MSMNWFYSQLMPKTCAGAWREEGIFAGTSAAGVAGWCKKLPKNGERRGDCVQCLRPETAICPPVFFSRIKPLNLALKTLMNIDKNFTPRLELSAAHPEGEEGISRHGQVASYVRGVNRCL
jgi:hypothetical protein